MPDLTAIDVEKKELRREAQRRRREVHEKIGHEAGEKLAAVFLNNIDIPKGKIVSVYFPIEGSTEIDTRPLLQELHQLGITIGLPLTGPRLTPLTFRRWIPGVPMVASGFKTQEPGPSQPEVTPDIVLVPLLGFDRAGNRLGFGAGHYDATLEKLRANNPKLKAYGIAYAVQEFDELPFDQYDQKLDKIITEKGIVRLNAKVTPLLASCVL